jgi:branched-chain amino acid transport system substrate-binding protein
MNDTDGPSTPVAQQTTGTTDTNKNIQINMEEPKPQNKNRLLLLVAAAIIIVGGAVGAWMYLNQSKSDEKVNIGVMLPFSGDESAPFGFSALKGIQLAQKQLDAKNIVLHQEDSKCDADATKRAIEKLAAKKVVAIIGEACSDATANVLSYANENKIVLISPSASSQELSKPNDYFFRVIPPDNVQGKFAAKVMYDKGYRTVATLNSTDDYSTGLTKAFANAFKEMGGTVATNPTFENEALKVDDQVNDVKTVNPDAIYMMGTSSTVEILLRQLRAVGVSVPIYSGDALYDEELVSNVGDAAEGLTITNFATGAQTFRQALRNAYPSDNQTYGAAQAYDAFEALQRAIKNGATTGEEVKQALSTMKFSGVSGPMNFDSNGEISDPAYTYDLLEVKDGQFVKVN